jgi:3-oxoacyl-[acyl-carrier-protein] synthase II
MPNLEEPDDELKTLNIPRETQDAEVNVILKNSFGFGGHNASLIFVKS